MSNIIIVSPHPDDELIGLSSVLIGNNTNPIIIYTEDIEQNRREESMELKSHVNIKAQLFQKNVPSSFLSKDNIFYFPDPIFETHPVHRLQGIQGEQLARNGYFVIFYTTNMLAPYIHEIKEPKIKEDLLNKVYPSQSSLWQYEKKYVLFEGFCRWIF